MSDLLTIVTLNLHRGRDRWLRRRSQLVTALLDLNPDVIALQEVALLLFQGEWLRAQLNARAATSQPYHYYQRRRPAFPDGVLEGIGLLCRRPVLSQDALALGLGRVALRINVELSSGMTVDIVTTHLHTRPEAHQTREEQLLRLMEWLHGRSAVPQRVVTGGLFAEPHEPAVTRIKQFYGYRSAYAELYGAEPPATCPTALVATAETRGRCLDYIFVSPAVPRVQTARLCCNRAAADDNTLYPSHHVGVWAEIALR